MAQVVLENIYKSFPHRRGEIANSDNYSPKDTLQKSSSKSRNVNVLRRINLKVEDGEFMVLVGPSGCGKSTLLRVIAGLESLTGGNIYLGDRPVNDLPPKERDMAMVFQNYALYPHLSVYDNLAFGLRRIGKQEPQKLDLWSDLLVGVTKSLPPKWRYLSDREREINTQVRKVAQTLQIEHLLHRLPKELSGGQKQRVALGRAMAREPQVFLMDEPLSNLDAKLRAETRSQIVKLQRQLGTTAIYVTHDQTEAMTMGDRIAVMNQGELQQVATPLELYNQPANRFVAEFIGSPPMNFLSVQVKAPLLITHDQFRLTLPQSWEPYLQDYHESSLWLGIRAEDLKISPPATRNLRVQVDLVEALGNDTYICVHPTEAENQSLQVRIPPDQPVARGDIFWLSMNLDKIHLFDPKTSKSIKLGKTE